MYYNIGLGLIEKNSSRLCLGVSVGIVIPARSLSEVEVKTGI